MPITEAKLSRGRFVQAMCIVHGHGNRGQIWWNTKQPESTQAQLEADLLLLPHLESNLPVRPWFLPSSTGVTPKLGLYGLTYKSYTPIFLATEGQDMKTARERVLICLAFANVVTEITHCFLSFLLMDIKQIHTWNCFSLLVRC